MNILDMISQYLKMFLELLMTAISHIQQWFEPLTPDTGDKIQLAWAFIIGVMKIPILREFTLLAIVVAIIKVIKTLRRNNII